MKTIIVKCWGILLSGDYPCFEDGGRPMLFHKKSLATPWLHKGERVCRVKVEYEIGRSAQGKEPKP